MTNDLINIYEIDSTSRSCYGVDVSASKNIVLVKEMMLQEDFGWYDSKINDFLMSDFNDVENIVSNFSDLDRAEGAITYWLSNVWELNPEKITLTYYDGKVVFIPKEPWDYSEAEKNLKKEKLFDLLKETAKLFKVNE